MPKLQYLGSVEEEKGLKYLGSVEPEKPGLIKKGFSWIHQYMPKEVKLTSEEIESFHETDPTTYFALKKYEEISKKPSAKLTSEENILLQTGPEESLKWALGTLPIVGPKILEKIGIIRHAKEIEKNIPIPKFPETVPIHIREERLVDLARRVTLPTSSYPTPTSQILELARRQTLPPKPGFQRTAEDILAERKMGGVVESPKLRTEIIPEAKVEMPETSIESTEALVKGGPISKLPKYAGGEKAMVPGVNVSAINLQRIEGSEELKQFINNMALQYEKKIGRQVIPWKETLKRAEDMGLSHKDAIRLAKGRTNYSAEMAAIEQIHRNAAEDTFTAIKNMPVDPIQRTPEMLARFTDKLNLYSEVLSNTSKMKSDWGRAGSIQRRMKAYEPGFVLRTQREKIIKEVLREYGGTDRINDLVNRLQSVDLSDMKSMNQLIYSMTKTKWQKLSDGAYELWINGLLSNPPTHVANITGNSLALIMSYPERLMGAGVEVIRSTITGEPRQIFAGETTHDIFSFVKGTHDATKAFLDSMKTGQGFGKLEFRPTALPKGMQMFMPTRALVAEDVFFKSFIQNAELNRFAYRQAMKEGLKGQAKNLRITELLSNPTEGMLEEAFKRADYVTFNKELGKIGNWVMHGRNIVPGLKYFVPFIRTPVNIAKYTLERTPLNLGRIIYKAGKGEMVGAELSESIARMLTGSFLGLQSYLWAKEGVITGGGPKTKAEREEWLRIHQSYSVRIRGKDYSYARFEPISSIIGMCADFAQLENKMTEGEKVKVAGAIGGAISKNITSKTFTQGFTRLNDAISDPEKYAEQTTESLAGSIVPGIAGGIARTIDPEIKDAQGILDQIKRRIPFVSKNVRPKLNIWGDVIKEEGHPLFRFISPMKIKTVGETPIDIELSRLKLNLGMPPKKMGNKELTPEEYTKYTVSSGQIAKEILNKLVQSEEYKKLPDVLKESKIKSIMQQCRKMAQKEIVVEMAPEDIIKTFKTLDRILNE